LRDARDHCAINDFYVRRMRLAAWIGSRGLAQRAVACFGRRPPEDAMNRTLMSVALLIGLTAAARAQDVQGIELCTRETSMDRRTGCLQSNIAYLQSVIAKNAQEARQKLGTAAGEVGALKVEVAALKGDVATLKAALATVQERIAKLETAAAKPAAKPLDKPAAPAPPPK
jgi:hypothetical protein